jgi:hypothetical protein
MHVLISSTCSFWISREAVLRARELDASWAFPDHIKLKGEPGSFLNERDRDEHYSLDHRVPRHDPVLLQVFDELGSKMSGWLGEEIHCVEVPDDVSYFVGSYIAEWIAEAHRTWSEDGEHRGGYPVFTKDSKFSDFTT